MKIVFVGLSNKIGKQPFDISTNSGMIIHQIANQVDCECYFINVVQYAPLDTNKKLRYPTKEEIKQSLPEFLKCLDDIKPNLIISFGKIVSDELSNINIHNCKLITRQHPSYIYIYKRSEINNYINEIVTTIKQNFFQILI